MLLSKLVLYSYKNQKDHRCVTIIYEIYEYCVLYINKLYFNFYSTFFIILVINQIHNILASLFS